MSEPSATLSASAQDLVAHLKKRDLRVVLAESCTAGMIAASLGLVPGVSGYLCGSAVVYREQTKIAWLGADAGVLGEHTTESLVASREVARGVLEKTPEADVSLGITGHFGPGAPKDLDGVVFVAAFQRVGDQINLLREERVQLKSVSRGDRQQEAALVAIRFLSRSL